MRGMGHTIQRAVGSTTTCFKLLVELFLKQIILFTQTGMVYGTPTPPPCPHLEPNENGRTLFNSGDWHCCGCPPGYRLEEICSGNNNLQSKCIKCDPGTSVLKKAHSQTTCDAIPGYVQPTNSSPLSSSSTTTTASTIATDNTAQSYQTKPNGFTIAFGVTVVVVAILLAVGAYFCYWHLKRRKTNKRTQQAEKKLSTTDFDGKKCTDRLFKDHSETDFCHPSKSYQGKMKTSKCEVFKEERDSKGKPSSDNTSSSSNLMPIPASPKPRIHDGSDGIPKFVRSESNVIAEVPRKKGKPLSDNDSFSSSNSIQTPATSKSYTEQSSGTHSKISSSAHNFVMKQQPLEASKDTFKCIPPSWDREENSKPYKEGNEMETIYEIFLTIENQNMIEISDNQILEFANKFNVNLNEIFCTAAKDTKGSLLACIFKKIYNAQGKKLEAAEIIQHFFDSGQALLAEHLQQAIEASPKLSPEQQHSASTKPF